MKVAGAEITKSKEVSRNRSERKNKIKAEFEGKKNSNQDKTKDTKPSWFTNTTNN